MPTIATRFLHCEGEPPYKPGASPFQIKGEFYRQMAPAIVHHDKQANGALVRILAREGLAGFWDQPFLSSAMYDALPLPRLMMAIAEARQRDVRALTLKMGMAAVAQSMNGVYANLLRAIGPRNFCARFEQLITYLYNFGPVKVTPADGGVSVVRHGVPLCMAEWWSLVTRAFAEVPLAAHGATEMMLDWRVAPTGLDRGVPCGTIVWELRWMGPAAEP